MPVVETEGLEWNPVTIIGDNSQTTYKTDDTGIVHTTLNTLDGGLEAWGIFDDNAIKFRNKLAKIDSDEERLMFYSKFADTKYANYILRYYMENVKDMTGDTMKKFQALLNQQIAKLFATGSIGKFVSNVNSKTSSIVNSKLLLKIIQGTADLSAALTFLDSLLPEGSVPLGSMIGKTKSTMTKKALKDFLKQKGKDILNKAESFAIDQEPQIIYFAVAEASKYYQVIKDEVEKKITDVTGYTIPELTYYCNTGLSYYRAVKELYKAKQNRDKAKSKSSSASSGTASISKVQTLKMKKNGFALDNLSSDQIDIVINDTKADLEDWLIMQSSGIWNGFMVMTITEEVQKAKDIISNIKNINLKEFVAEIKSLESLVDFLGKQGISATPTTSNFGYDISALTNVYKNALSTVKGMSFDDVLDGLKSSMSSLKVTLKSSVNDSTSSLTVYKYDLTVIDAKSGTLKLTMTVDPNIADNYKVLYSYLKNIGIFQLSSVSDIADNAKKYYASHDQTLFSTTYPSAKNSSLRYTVQFEVKTVTAAVSASSDIAEAKAEQKKEKEEAKLHKKYIDSEYPEIKKKVQAYGYDKLTDAEKAIYDEKTEQMRLENGRVITPLLAYCYSLLTDLCPKLKLIGKLVSNYQTNKAMSIEQARFNLDLYKKAYNNLKNFLKKTFGNKSEYLMYIVRTQDVLDYIDTSVYGSYSQETIDNLNKLDSSIVDSSISFTVKYVLRDYAPDFVKFLDEHDYDYSTITSKITDFTMVSPDYKDIMCMVHIDGGKNGSADGIDGVEYYPSLAEIQISADPKKSTYESQIVESIAEGFPAFETSAETYPDFVQNSSTKVYTLSDLKSFLSDNSVQIYNAYANAMGLNPFSQTAVDNLNALLEDPSTDLSKVYVSDDGSVYSQDSSDSSSMPLLTVLKKVHSISLCDTDQTEPYLPFSSSDSPTTEDGYIEYLNKETDSLSDLIDNPTADNAVSSSSDNLGNHAVIEFAQETNEWPAEQYKIFLNGRDQLTNETIVGQCMQDGKMVSIKSMFSKGTVRADSDGSAERMFKSNGCDRHVIIDDFMTEESKDVDIESVDKCSQKLENSNYAFNLFKSSLCYSVLPTILSHREEKPSLLSRDGLTIYNDYKQHIDETIDNICLSLGFTKKQAKKAGKVIANKVTSTNGDYTSLKGVSEELIEVREKFLTGTHDWSKKKNGLFDLYSNYKDKQDKCKLDTSFSDCKLLGPKYYVQLLADIDISDSDNTYAAKYYSLISEILTKRDYFEKVALDDIVKSIEDFGRKLSLNIKSESLVDSLNAEFNSSEKSYELVYQWIYGNLINQDDTDQLEYARQTANVYLYYADYDKSFKIEQSELDSMDIFSLTIEEKNKLESFWTSLITEYTNSLSLDTVIEEITDEFSQNFAEWPSPTDIQISGQTYKLFLFTNIDAKNAAVADSSDSTDLSAIDISNIIEPEVPKYEYKDASSDLTSTDTNDIEKALKDLNGKYNQFSLAPKYWYRYFGLGSALMALNPKFWAVGMVISGIPVYCPIILLPLVSIPLNHYGLVFVLGLSICGLQIQFMGFCMNASSDSRSFMLPMVKIVEQIKQVADIKLNKLSESAFNIVTLYIDKLKKENADYETENKDLQQTIDQLKLCRGKNVSLAKSYLDIYVAQDLKSWTQNVVRLHDLNTAINSTIDAAETLASTDSSTTVVDVTEISTPTVDLQKIADGLIKSTNAEADQLTDEQAADTEISGKI